MSWTAKDVDRFLLGWFNIEPSTPIEDTVAFRLRFPFLLTWIFGSRSLAMDYLHQEYARLIPPRPIASRAQT